MPSRTQAARREPVEITAQPPNSAARTIMNMPDDTGALVPPGQTYVAPVQQAAPPILSDDPGLADQFRQEDDFQALLLELGAEGEYAEGHVAVWVRNPVNRRFEWLDRIEAPALAAEGMPMIARYGAGEYQLYIYSGGARGIRKRQMVTINAAAARKYGVPDPSVPNAPATVAAPVSPELAEIREMMRGMLQLQAQQLQKPGGNSQLMETIAMMKALREAMGGNEARPQQDAFGMMRQTIGLMRDLEPPPEGSSASMMQTFGGFVEKIAPMLQLFAQQAQQQPRPAIQAPAQPAAAATARTPVDAPAGDASAEGANVGMMQNMQAKFFMSMLVDSAKQNADPISYAGMILDKVPAETVAEWQALPDEDFVKRLAAIDPDVQQHPTWFLELRDKIKELQIESSNADLSAP